MANELNNRKLDDAIKQSLSAYEPPYDNADWEKMEKALAAAPQPTTIKWSYIAAIVGGVAVLCGGYFLFSTLKSSGFFERTSIVIPADTLKDTTKSVITTPVIPEDTIVPEVLAIPDTEVTENPIPETPVVDETPVKTEDTALIKKDDKVKKETAKNEKTKDKKTKESSKENKKELNNREELLKKNKEHVFGDSPDSTKGNIGEPKEGSGTKKDAVPETVYPVGWNKFALSNVNPDSIRKHREQMKKDTIK